MLHGSGSRINGHCLDSSKLATINSPGGYLRSLTQKAREGVFQSASFCFQE
ncbi:hypothetical protein HED49_23480 [Ochrobactrum daejeonense]|nr:hypothetical protein [Brucella daejeonensis]